MEEKACFRSSILYKGSIFLLRSCQKSYQSQGNHSQSCVYISFGFNKAAIHTLTGIFGLTVKVYGMPLTLRSRFGYGHECLWEGTSPETLKQQGRAPFPTAAGASGKACREASPHSTVGVLLSRSEVRCDRVLWANLGGVKYNFVFTAQHQKANK